MDRFDLSSLPPDGRSSPPIGTRRQGTRFRLRVRGEAMGAAAPGAAGAHAGAALSSRAASISLAQIGDPFVARFSGAAPFRSYVASVESNGRDLIPFVTIVIQPNEYPGLRGTTSQPAATNLQMEKVWLEAVRSAMPAAAGRAGGAAVSPGAGAAWPGAAGAAVGPSGAAAPIAASMAGASVGASAAATTDASTASVPRSGPLAFCVLTWEYIEPVCPGCLGRLSLCRDETLLRTSGLPAYATTLSRYLYCAVCSAEPGRAPTFFTYSLRDGDAVPAGVRVRRRGELYRDLAPAIHGQARPVDAEHFCFECPHRGTCYPAGRSVDAPVPAEDLLFPLAYYENFYIPVETQPLDFTEVAAFLGGAAAGEAIGASATPPDPGDRPRSESFDKLSTAGAQFFFEGDSSGLLALEALHLKLAAFAVLVREVRDLHGLALRPHLALSPERVRGRLDWQGEGAMPVRWGLSLGIGDLLTTAPLQLFEPLPLEPRVWSIPYPLPEPFVPDGMSRIQSESMFMRLAVRDLVVDSTPAGQVARLTAELVSDGYRESDHGRHDLVRLSADTVAGFDGRLLFSGRKAGVIPRGFLFEGVSAPLSPEAARNLDPKRLPASWSVEATIVHTFAAPADVMSLGLLLLKLLLTNDRQDGSHLNRDGASRLAAIVSAPGAASGNAGRRGDKGAVGANIAGANVRGGANVATADVRGGADNSGPVDRLKRFADAFARESLECGPREVLFRESDRSHAEPAIPPILWEETLDLALRMASNIPGWSVCAGQDDYDDDRPARAFERVLEELDNLVERARGGLIGSSGRNGLVLEICDDFLADFREASVNLAKAASASDEPQMTVVVSPRSGR